MDRLVMYDNLLRRSLLGSKFKFRLSREDPRTLRVYGNEAVACRLGACLAYQQYSRRQSIGSVFQMQV
jgi:hypothetical protein